jgi:hypothetical protein
MSTHICKCKNDTVESISGMWGRRQIKESAGGSEFKYNICDTL